MNAPKSGRVSSRVAQPRWTRRSSCRTVSAAVWAMVVRAGTGVGDRNRPPPFLVLARALGGEHGDSRCVALVDDAGPGQHRLSVSNGVQVGDVEDGEDDGQVALEVLLLVDREQQPPGPDLLDRAADIERAGLRALRDRV